VRTSGLLLGIKEAAHAGVPKAEKLKEAWGEALETVYGAETSRVLVEKCKSEGNGIPLPPSLHHYYDLNHDSEGTTDMIAFLPLLTNGKDSLSTEPQDLWALVLVRGAKATLEWKIQIAGEIYATEGQPLENIGLATTTTFPDKAREAVMSLCSEEFKGQEQDHMVKTVMGFSHGLLPLGGYTQMKLKNVMPLALRLRACRFLGHVTLGKLRNGGSGYSESSSGNRCELTEAEAQELANLPPAWEVGEDTR